MPTSKSKLPPIDFKEDIAVFEAHHEEKEAVFLACFHRDTTIKDGRLSCKCGASWKDIIPNLIKLQQLLKSRPV